ncbi:MAG: glycosyltransferase family 2 protein [Candidatus Hydrogenedentota bacterium]
MNKINEVAIGIVTYNPGEELIDCLNSIKETGFTGRNIVWDNSETDNRDRFKRLYKETEFYHSPQNIGYAKAINKIFEITDSEFVLVLNSDVVLERNTLSVLLAKIKSDGSIGLVSCRYLNPDKTQQPNYSLRFLNYFDLILEKLFYIQSLIIKIENSKILRQYVNNRYSTDRYVGWIGGSCMMIRREAFNSVSGFDPDFFLYFEEMEFQRRLIESGWKIFYTSETKIIHHWSKSVSKVSDEILLHIRLSELIYVKKYFGKIKYNIFKFIIYLETYVKSLIFYFLQNKNRAEMYKKLRRVLDGEIIKEIQDKYEPKVLKNLRI